MPYENRVPDKVLMNKVTQRLSQCGAGAQLRVNATIRNGTVTLSGMLDFDYQRKPILRAVSGVQGVRNVVDRLTVKPALHWAKEDDKTRKRYDVQL
jgi:osmotically-inducible protein OsmY